FPAILYVSSSNVNGTFNNIQQGLDFGLGVAFANTPKQPPDYLVPQGFYDQAIVVDPSDFNHVVVAGVINGITNGIFETFDGGVLGWTDIGLGVDSFAPHTDYHALAFDANGKLLAGNDGGIWRLSDPTIPVPGSNPPSPPYNIHWTNLNANLQTIQFTGIAINPLDPNIAYGGSQD